MKKILISVLPLLMSTGIFAQNFRIQLPPGYNKIYIESEPINSIEGSPFLYESWIPGILNLKNGQTINGLSYRYDAQNDEMQYYNEGIAYIIITPDSIKELMISSKTFMYFNYIEAKKNKKGYFEVLENGKASLLIKYYINIKKSNFKPALNTGNKNDVRELKEKYYLKIGDQFYPLGRKWETLTDVLPDKKLEVEGFIQKEGLKAKNKTDICNLLKFYNSLN